MAKLRGLGAAHLIVSSSGATRFGGAISVSGTRIAVATDGDIACGPVFIFDRGSGGKWVRTATLQLGGSSCGHRFGAAISLFRDRLLVSMPDLLIKRVESGAAALYERRKNATWDHVATLSPPAGAPVAQFGGAVLLTGDQAVVHAHRGVAENDARMPAVYVYKRAPRGQWRHAQTLVTHNQRTPYAARSALLLTGGLLLVTAPNSGPVAVYEAANTGDWRLLGRTYVDGAATRAAC